MSTVKGQTGTLSILDQEDDLEEDAVKISTSQFTGDTDDEPTVILLHDSPKSRILERTRAEINLICTRVVETEAHNYILEYLKTEQWITITGCPGAGKSVMGYLILKHFQTKQFITLAIKNANEFNSIPCFTDNTIIFFDDVFGCHWLEHTKLDDLLRIFNTLKDLKMVSVVFASRLHIFQEALAYLGLFKNSLFKTSSTVNLTDLVRLTPDEKKRILQCHLANKDMKLDDDIINKIICSFCDGQSIHGFPHLCELFTHCTSAWKEPLDFFHKALLAVQAIVDTLFKDDVKRTLLYIMVQEGGSLNTEKIRNSVFVQNVSNIAGAPNVSFIHLQNAVSSLNGSFLKREGKKIEFKHPSLYECSAQAIGKLDPLFVIQHGHIQYVCERVRFQTDNNDQLGPTPEETELILDPDYMQNLLERFVEEIGAGNFTDICRYYLQCEETFVDSFFKLAMAKYDTGTIVHSRDKTHDHYLTYWATSNRSDAMTNYILNKFPVNDDEIRDALLGCCAFGNPRALKSLLDNVDNAETLVNTTRFAGIPLIIHAGSRGNIEVIDLLINEGVNKYLKDNKFGGNVLLWAAAAGQANVVQHLLNVGMDVNSSNSRGVTALYLASQNGNVDVVKTLIKFGPSINKTIEVNDVSLSISPDQRDIQIENQVFRNQDFTALQVASKEGHTDVVDILLAAGADKDLVSKGRGSSLHVAAKDGRSQVAKKLITAGADINVTWKDATPLDSAFVFGHKNVVEVILCVSPGVSNSHFHTALLNGEIDEAKRYTAEGIDINSITVHGYTGLHFAACSGSLQLVDFLIKAGAKVDAKTDFGITPLFGSSATGSGGIAQLLLKSGANPGSTDRQGIDPLHHACRMGHDNVAKILLEAGAEVNKTGYGGCASLHWACFYGRTSVAKLLLTTNSKKKIGTSQSTNSKFLYGTNVNLQNQHQYTPLMRAAQRGRIDIVKEFLKVDVDVNHCAGIRGTALHQASSWGHPLIVKELLNGKASISSRCSNGSTPLHWAAWRGHVDVVKILLDSGADVNAPDATAGTPLHTATEAGHLRVVQILLENKANPQIQNKNHETALQVALSRGHIQIADILSRNNQDRTIQTKRCRDSDGEQLDEQTKKRKFYG